MIKFFKRKNKTKRVIDKPSNIESGFSFSFLDNNQKVKPNKKIIKNEKLEEIKKPKLRFMFLNFLFIFFSIFIAIMVLSYVFKKSKNAKINIYEVNSGEIVKEDKNEGMIIRSEIVESCKESGYINFFAYNNSKVNKGSLVYIISDEEKIFKDENNNTTDYSLLKSQIKNYVNNITNDNFIFVYTYNQNLNALTKELNVIKQLSNIENNTEIVAKEAGYCQNAGILSYHVDGFEDFNMMNFSNDNLTESEYIETLNSRKLVNKNDNIYKIIDKPDYNIVFQSNNNYDDLIKKGTVKVKFPYDNIETTCEIAKAINNSGENIYILTLNNYLESFLDRRKINFEIVSENYQGLKIPISAILHKNCFNIKKSMLISDSYSDEKYFMKQVGEEQIKVVVDVAKEDDEYYYVSTKETLGDLNYGDVLVNGEETYTLNSTISLDGVYNVNKGYAVFKNIEILEKTSEYAIIKRGTKSGLSIYDHIALNATKINEGDLIS